MRRSLSAPHVSSCIPLVCAGVCAGETQSEGGFGKDKVSKAALLGVEQATDSKGKPYYKYELLTTAGAQQLPARVPLPALTTTSERRLLVKLMI